MLLPEPLRHLLPQANGQCDHGVCLTARYGPDLLVDRNVPLAPTTVQKIHIFLVRAGGEDQALDASLVLVLPFRLVPLRRQRHHRQLQRRIERDIKPPLVPQRRRLALLDITIGDGEQVGDFLRGRFVPANPIVLQIDFQAHLRRR